MASVSALQSDHLAAGSIDLPASCPSHLSLPFADDEARACNHCDASSELARLVRVRH